MPPRPITISLPIADRRTSCAFYRHILSLDPFGQPADDGVPEPLQFALSEGLTMMLIPSGGFGWVVGDHEVAPKDTSECLLSITVDTDAQVGEVIERAAEAGATVVTEPGRQPWGYAGTFADPDCHLWMVISAATSAWRHGAPREGEIRTAG